MRVLHIVAGMPPESGMAAVVARLAAAEQRLTQEVAVATTQEKFVSSLVHYCISEEGVRVKSFKRSFPKFLFFSWGMVWGLGREVRAADVVHVHGCWTFPVWWGAWLALRNKKTLVMSPHGALNPLQLQHSAWKKRLVGWMDRGLLRRASVVHATCEGENAWVQAFLGREVGGQRTEVGGSAFADTATADRQRAEVGDQRTEDRDRRPRIVVIPNGVGEVH